MSTKNNFPFPARQDRVAKSGGVVNRDGRDEHETPPSGWIVLENRDIFHTTQVILNAAAIRKQKNRRRDISISVPPSSPPPGWAICHACSLRRCGVPVYISTPTRQKETPPPPISLIPGELLFQQPPNLQTVPVPSRASSFPLYKENAPLPPNPHPSIPFWYIKDSSVSRDIHPSLPPSTLTGAPSRHRSPKTDVAPGYQHNTPTSETRSSKDNTNTPPLIRTIPHLQIPHRHRPHPAAQPMMLMEPRHPCHAPHPLLLLLAHPVVMEPT